MDKIPVRSRRTKNYWEPMFDARTPDKFHAHDWNFENNIGPQYCVFLAEKIPDKNGKKISGVIFKNCDFGGDFKEKLIFVGCEFHKCDFGLSIFREAKFTKCKFHLSSLTQSRLLNSEFRDCIFDKIGLSGNETMLDGTLITNPGQFINAAYANVENLPAGKSKLEQKLRLQETKSTISRVLLANLTREGSEATFYDAVKYSTIYECRAKIARSILSLTSRWGVNGYSKWGSGADVISISGGVVDFFTLYTFGLINSWGSSLSRPIMVGGALLGAFAIAYKVQVQAGWGAAFKTAAEVMLLFGYTNYAVKWSVNMIDLTVLANALVGVGWYVVTVPTIVNKITRVRN